MNLPALVRHSALAVGFTLLTGCTALDPVTDTTRFYTLSSAADFGRLAAVAPAEAPVIGVRVTEVASHLRPSAIAVRRGDHELDYAEQHRWASRLDDAVAGAVAAGIQRAAGSRISVTVTRPARSVVPDVLVEIDLVACEGIRSPGAAALLVADWRVFSGRGDKPAANGRFRVDKPGWNGSDFGQLAALLAGATDDLAQAVAGPAVKIAGEPQPDTPTSGEAEQPAS